MDIKMKIKIEYLKRTMMKREKEMNIINKDEDEILSKFNSFSWLSLKVNCVP